MTLAVIQTHPIQYYAPTYAKLQSEYGIKTWAIYGSDFSIKGYRDVDFGRTLAWNSDLTTGYQQIFLSSHSPNQLTARGMGAAIDRIKPSVIMVTGYIPAKFYLPAIFGALGRRIPIIFKADTTDVALKRSFVKNISRRMILTALYRPMQFLLYGGKHSKQHYLDLGVPVSKLIFSPMSVPSRSGMKSSERGRVMRVKLGIPDDIVIALFSGKMIRKKSPDHLLEAAFNLPTEVKKKLAIIFMGDGILKKDMEAWASRTSHGLHAIHFVGFKNQDEIDDYYSACDFLVLCSLFGETWGLVVNEALMHGKPCIVSDRVGCWEDLIVPGRTGAVYSAGNVHQLREAILSVLDLVRVHNTDQRCREMVETYSTERTTAGIAEAYRRVTGSMPGN